MGFLIISVSDPGFFSPGSAFFSESGSGSAKNPDPIRKNPDMRKKTVLKLEVKLKKVLYFISNTIDIVLFGQATPKPG